MDAVVVKNIATKNSQTDQGVMSQQTIKQEEVFMLSQYWRTIKRAKWGIMCLTICCLIIGWLIATSMPPIYVATAKIMAAQEQSNADPIKQYIASGEESLYYATQYDIIQSRKLAEMVVDKLNLVEKYKSQRASLQTKVPGFSDSLNNIKKKLTSMLANGEKKLQPAITDLDVRLMLATGIQAKTTVGRVSKNSQFINIVYSAEDPQHAAEIVNALSDAYILFGLKSRQSELKNTQMWLSEQYGPLKIQLRDSERKLSGFRNQQGMVDTTQQQQMANTQLQNLS
jgi:succinoglycan biosynthesis transport protein ExoP